MEQKHWVVYPWEESFVEESKVHLAYRISNSHLLRGALPANTSGGWMGIDRIDGLDTLEFLLPELLSETELFGYQAVFFALSSQIAESITSSLNALCKALSKRGISLILPITYAPYCNEAVFLVSSAISGGSLRIYLEDLIRTYGAQKLVLEHTLVRMEFPMPSEGGSGTPLTEAELQTILSRPDLQPFYSPELCLNYCTYQTDRLARFLLFDDARSLTAKYQLGCSLGIKYHLFLYYESKNFYHEL